MRKLLFLLLVATAYAQPANPPILNVSVAPAGACSLGLPDEQVISTGVLYSCQGGTWGIIPSGGSSGVASINGSAGAFTFNGSGVNCLTTTCTFSGVGTTTNALTANISGGAAPGTTFNGAAGVTFDYHTLGAANFPTGNGIPTVNTAGTAWSVTIPQIPAENYGAVADGNVTGGTGTDNTTSLQNAIAAVVSAGAGCVLLKSAQYKITAPLTISNSNVAFCGGGISTGAGGGSFIFTTSASTNVFTIGGSSGSPLSGISFTNMGIGRSVTPTGTATGFHLDWAHATFRNVDSVDSIDDWYQHASASNFIGPAGGGFGYNGVAEPSSGTTHSCFNVDSEDGHPSNSTLMINMGCVSASSLGIRLHGSAINDYFTQGYQSAVTKIPISVTYDGPGSGAGANDVHFWNSILDGFTQSGVVLTGVTSAALGSVEISGSHIVSLSASGACIDLESSPSVALISHNEIDCPTTGVKGISSPNAVISSNHFIGPMTNGLLLDNTSIPQGALVTNTATNVTSEIHNSGIATTYPFLLYQANTAAEYGITISNAANQTTSDTFFHVCGQLEGTCTEFYAFDTGFTGLNPVVQPASGYFATQAALTNGLFFNTETTAPLTLATNNTKALIIDGTTHASAFQFAISAPNITAATYGAGTLASGMVATTNPFSGDRSTQVATDQFVGSAIDFSQSRFPLAITGGTYSFDSQGSGALFVVGASGGAITSIITVGNPGTGYAVGDLLTIPAGGSIGGNSDAVIRVTGLSGSGVTSGSIVYGGTGYNGFAGSNTSSAAVGRPFTFVLSGTLTSNVQFIMKFGTFLTTSNQWIFANNTTGAFTVNVCEGNASDVCSGGSTVFLGQGVANSRQVFLETDGELNMFLAAIQNSLDLQFTPATASNCNQGGVLTSVTSCMPVTVSGVTHYTPVF